MERAAFEHILLALLARRAGITTRTQLFNAMTDAGFPGSYEKLRRNLITADFLSEELVQALQSVAPDLTDQDWVEIFWARFFPDKQPPRCS